MSNKPKYRIESRELGGFYLDALNAAGYYSCVGIVQSAQEAKEEIRKQEQAVKFVPETIYLDENGEIVSND